MRGGDDEMRAVLSFRPAVAPFKAVVLPLDNVVGRDPRNPTHAIQAALTAAGLSATIDDSGASIGKRYSRSDEVRQGAEEDAGAGRSVIDPQQRLPLSRRWACPLASRSTASHSRTAP